MSLIRIFAPDRVSPFLCVRVEEGPKSCKKVEIRSIGSRFCSLTAQLVVFYPLNIYFLRLAAVKL